MPKVTPYEAALAKALQDEMKMIDPTYEGPVFWTSDDENAGHHLDNQNNNNNTGIQETNPSSSQDDTVTANPTGFQGPESDADSEQEAEWDLDDEDVQPNSTFTANEEAPVYQNNVQNTGVDDGADAAVPVEGGEPVVNDEELAKWLGEHSHDLQAQIKKIEAKIQKAKELIIKHQNNADKWQKKHDDDHKAGKSGEYDLNKILKKKDDSLKHVEKWEKDLEKFIKSLNDLRNQSAEVEANPVGVYVNTKKPKVTKRSPRRKRRTKHDPSVSDPDHMGDDSLSDNPEFIRIRSEEAKKAKEKEAKGSKNASIACRRCRVRPIHTQRYIRVYTNLAACTASQNQMLQDTW